MRLHSGCRRGAAVIGVTIALATLLAASGMSFLMAVVMRGKQSAYERDAIQALYAAEAGVATTIALLNGGAQVRAGLRGDCGDATWAYTGRQPGGLQGMEFTGTARQRIGAPVERRVSVTLQRLKGGYRVARWELVPVPAPADSAQQRPPLLQPGTGEERR